MTGSAGVKPGVLALAHVDLKDGALSRGARMVRRSRLTRGGVELDAGGIDVQRLLDLVEPGLRAADGVGFAEALVLGGDAGFFELRHALKLVGQVGEIDAFGLQVLLLLLTASSSGFCAGDLGPGFAQSSKLEQRVTFLDCGYQSGRESFLMSPALGTAILTFSRRASTMPVAATD